MRYINLHNHTVFSDGKNTVEENIAAAQAQNMLALGFSDHSQTDCDLSYCMRRAQYGEYLDTIRKAAASADIPVYAGLELDAYSEDDCSSFDYFLASVHYIIRNGVCYPIDHSPRQQQECIRDAFGGSALDMAKCYFDLLGEHIAKTKPTFVGHFDVLAKFSLMPEEDDRYRQLACESLKQILQLCPYIEMNTGAISRGWRKGPYPADYLLDTVKDNGGLFLLSADSHSTQHLTFWFDQAVQHLKDHGIHKIACYTGSGFDTVSIAE